METANGIVTLLSDFGPGIYSASVKGVILSAAPNARIVDISHEIGPHNILEAALTLCAYAPTFPTGTLHLAVVDPGVGTLRRVVLLEAGGQFYLAPDNGLLTLVLRSGRDLRAWNVENEDFFRKPPSPTFHGRDIFAPVAGAIASGITPEAFGPEIPPESLCRLAIAEPVAAEGAIRGEIIFIDHFGNLVSNIDTDLLETLGSRESLLVDFQNVELAPIRTTYADVPSGEPLALVGSIGYLEIAVCLGSAQETFHPTPDEKIIVRRLGA